MKKIALFAALAMCFSSTAYADNTSDYVKNKIIAETTVKADMLTSQEPSELLAAVDGNSKFYEKDEYIPYNCLGFDVGMGIVLDAENEEKPSVACVIAGSAAEAAGVKAGDRLLYINDIDISTRKFALPTLASQVRGIKGSEVTLVFEDNGGNRKTVELVRDMPSVTTVEKSFLKNIEVDGEKFSAGYIKINTFSYNTPYEVKAAIQSCGETGIRNFIIDLRECSDGPVSAAIEAAALFVAENSSIGKTVDKNGENAIISHGEMTYGANAVLVNKGTRGAGQIFANILGESGRGGVIGESPKGESGIVKYFYVPDEGGYFTLTVGKYISEKGVDLSEEGLTCNVEVKNDIPSVYLERKFKLGDSGEEISEVKSLLGLLGYDAGEGNEYDEKVFKAVSDFQSENGLWSYGVCDYTTQREIVRKVYDEKKVEDLQMSEAYKYINENKYESK